MTPTRTPADLHLIHLIQSRATARQSWAEEAACRDAETGDSDAYFPPDNATPPREAIARCLACQVKAECLATGLIHDAADGARIGWWGGVGPTEREALWRELEPATTVATAVPAEREAGAPQEPRELARRLRARDYTVTAIAAELGCTDRTVYRYLAAGAA